MKLSDFNNNKNENKKLLDNFLNRLENVETKKGIKKNGKKREETKAEIEARFAKLREARAKERYGPGPGGTLTYGDVWDDITDEEIDYYSGKSKPKEKRMSPEERYQKIKKHGYYHGHEKGCNNSLDGVCVPTCRFFPEYGRVEDEEIFLFPKVK